MHRKNVNIFAKLILEAEDILMCQVGINMKFIATRKK